MSNNLNDEWENFITNYDANCETEFAFPAKFVVNDKTAGETPNIEPMCDELYISTKTMLLYLDKSNIDVSKIFWKLPIVEYWKPAEGIIKKQMKVASHSKEECAENMQKLAETYYYTERIIKQIDNPVAKKNKFKDERKITIGISTKNVTNYRGKEKCGAMFNCIAITFRFLNRDRRFHEIHVKVFNTGKLEIPGILNDSLFDRVKIFILDVMAPMFDEPIAFRDVPTENVLINSNFMCNFNINRDALHSILRTKYDIDATYDSCNYPGVKCKYYFYNEYGMDVEKQRGIVLDRDRGLTVEELIKTQKYTKVSFMIFRTGGCLIVGNCSEEVLRFVYDYVKKILLTEFPNIYISRVVDNSVATEDKKESKLRKRKIMVSTEYFSALKSIYT
jgi:hypothetical protein